VTPRLTLVSAPLPECAMCTRPTKRDVHKANGGLCSSCNDDIADIAHGLAQANTVRPLFPVDES